MNEENNIKEESTATNSTEGNFNQSTSIIDRANAAAERMEQANKKTEEILERQEELIAQKALGGTSEAGIEKEKPKEETDREYAERMIRGDPNKKDEK